MGSFRACLEQCVVHCNDVGRQLGSVREIHGDEIQVANEVVPLADCGRLTRS